MTAQLVEVYAGDLDPNAAWNLLAQEVGANLVDVRTDAEWNYVGVPDIAGLDKPLIKVSWKLFPAMQVNTDFVDTLATQITDKKQPLLFLCRSGIRSKSAAAEMTKAGYTQCYNITEGFEGDRDEAHHRGRRGGWKLRGLPWTQD